MHTNTEKPLTPHQRLRLKQQCVSKPSARRRGKQLLKERGSRKNGEKESQMGSQKHKDMKRKEQSGMDPLFTGRQINKIIRYIKRSKGISLHNKLSNRWIQINAELTIQPT